MTPFERFPVGDARAIGEIGEVRRGGVGATNGGGRRDISYGGLVRACAAVAASAGVIALIGWALELPFLASLGSGKIPMAPSTALLFVSYGIAIVARTRLPLRPAEYWLGTVVHCAGALAALLLFLLSYRGIYLSAERLGFSGAGTVAGAPIGHMSPLTAICFLLASLSFLVLPPSGSNRRWRSMAAWSAGCLLLAICCVLLLAYLYGTPLLYGGPFVPPAATTSLAFAALGIALVILAGPQVSSRDETVAATARPAPVLILVFVLFAVGVITAGYLYSRSLEAHHRKHEEIDLSATAELKAGVLAQYRKERLREGAVFFGNTAFHALAQRVLDDPADHEASAQLRSWLGEVQVYQQYDRIFLFDAHGAVRMAIPEAAERVASMVSRRVVEVLQSREIDFQDFYRDEHDRRIHLAILVPILSREASRRALGVLALRIDPETYLYPFINHQPAVSETLETLLVRRDGNDALLLNNLRFNGHAALTLRFPIERQEVPAVKAALGQEGIVEGVDYNGVPVIADVRAVGDSPWFLVTRIDASEVYAPLREPLWMTIGLVSLLLLGAGAGVGSVWRQQSSRFYRERYAAERNRAWLREVIARSLNEIYVFEPDTLRFSFANDGACRNIGYTAEELVRLTPLDLEPEFTEESFRTMLEPLRTGERDVLVFETIHRRSDGSEYPVEAHLQHVSAEGEPVFLAIINDVTERQQLETQLRQSQKMEAVGRLAGGIAHDFNNQIFVINGYCDLLLGEAAGQPAFLGPLEEIKKAAQRSAELTAQLLAFSRKQLLQPKILDLNAELTGIEPMLRRLIGEDVRLSFLLAQDVGHVKVDPSQLQQVVMNLAVNARDAMPYGGKLTIETNNVVLDEAYARSRLEVLPGPYVMLSMSDTGHGMDRETLAHMFEPFFTTKGPGKGTGLGLATAHGIIKQSGGHISAYSEVGHGTTFKIYLPRLDEPAETTERPVLEQPAGGVETILLVEDETAARELVYRVLTERGYQVLSAADGKEALRLVERCAGPIHLLLTDVVMPEMSGSQLAGRLRAIYPETRVIYMSGYTENAIVHHGVLEAGLTFLPKPCPTNLLLRKVREVLDAPVPLNIRGRRILVVDDSEDERILQSRMLSKVGCSVLAAGSAPDALSLLEREAVDAVITDVNMLPMDGFALTEAIRRSPRWRSLPVIILTGAYSEHEEKRSREAGATAYVSKGTTDQHRLLEILAGAL